MKSITTAIVMNANREKVWNILSDFPAYPDWNPFITKITGDLT
jgi:ribosome-associated toxin RatA of RatAB toxin-antitoxin module